ncbi:hypothetical protein BC830DRAFT_1157780 [Chytriomyces sp. MP71]|nr:hypothetical protein BC830DRAFT_1157780 [Chytriomyces sp. MP71]
MASIPAGTIVSSGTSATITYFGDLFNTQDGFIVSNGKEIAQTACGPNVPPVDPTLFAAPSVFSLVNQKSIVDSGLCGQCMTLTGPKGSVTVTIIDVMLDENKKPQDMDLSTAAFDRIANVADGVTTGITWVWSACDGSTSPPAPSTVAPPTEVGVTATPSPVPSPTNIEAAPSVSSMIPTSTSLVESASVTSSGTTDALTTIIPIASAPVIMPVDGAAPAYVPATQLYVSSAVFIAKSAISSIAVFFLL